MDKKKKKIFFSSLLIIIIILAGFSVFFELPKEWVENRLAGNGVLVGLTYTALLIVTTVLAPLAGLPFAPVAALEIGPALTTLLSVIGWTIGAVIAFLIARHIGRPMLIRLVDMQKVEKYESYIPKRHVFLWLVFLRVIIPVDVLSYAIGLASTIQLPLYTLSTALGVIPFSIIWVYGGHAFIERNYTSFFIFAGFGLLLFFVSVYVYLQRRKKLK